MNFERIDGVYAMSDERLSHNSFIIIATSYSAKSFAIKDGSPLVPRM